MSRKDYIKIADTLSQIWQEIQDEGERIFGEDMNEQGREKAWEEFKTIVVDPFADMLKEDNIRFNHTKFINYINNK